MKISTGNANTNVAQHNQLQKKMTMSGADIILASNSRQQGPTAMVSATRDRKGKNRKFRKVCNIDDSTF